MKLKLNPKYTQIAVYALIVIVVSGFLLMSAQSMPDLKQMADNLFTALSPIVWGCVIAYLLNPAVDFFRFSVFKKYSENVSSVKKRNFIRNISIFIVVILAIGFITGLFFLIVPQLVTSIKGIIDKFDDYVANVTEWVNNLFGEQPQLLEYIQKPIQQLTDYINNSWADISKHIVDLSTAVGGNVLGILIGLKDFIIGFMIAIYILISKDFLKSQFKKILFALFKNNSVQSFLNVIRRTNDIFSHYVTSVLIDAFIIGCATFVFASIAGIPYSIVITVIVAVTNIIPFFGPFLGGIPSFLLILLVDPVKALWFGIFIIVLQQCDGNIIKPVLYGETMGLPAIWVLISIILASGLFGITGMLIGVPVFSVFYMLIKEVLDVKLEKKKLPSEGSLYNRDDIDKFVDGYEYSDEERKADEKWLEGLKEPEKEKPLSFLRKKEKNSKKSDKNGKNK